MSTLPAPLVAYRAWRVDRSGRLRAIGSGAWWHASGIEVARCVRTDVRAHQAPAPGCACGVHALDSCARAQAFARARVRKPLRSDVVVGAVQLWGLIAVGECAGRAHGGAHGAQGGAQGLQYRAQFARVVAIAAGGARARRAATAHGVALVQPDYLEAYAREMGVQLGIGLAPAPPSSLRPTGASARRALVRLVRLLWFLARWTLRIAWWLARLAALALGTALESVLGRPARRPHGWMR